MEWRELAGDLVRAGAPIIGGALGGPIGGMIGSTAGKIIADALGVEPTPEAVGNAVKTLPADDVAARLKKADAEAAAQWPALAEIGKAQVAAIGETQRTELQLGTQLTGGWRIGLVVLQGSWRPLAMFVWIATWPFQLAAVLHHAYLKDAAALNGLAEIVNALAWWNTGPAALAGVYAVGRTYEKVKGAAVAAGGMIGAMKQAVSRK